MVSERIPRKELQVIDVTCDINKFYSDYIWVMGVSFFTSKLNFKHCFSWLW
jgi:hypothetical protein